MYNDLNYEMSGSSSVSDGSMIGAGNKNNALIITAYI
jgi:hypothetical protein